PKMIWQFGELGYDVSIDYNGRVGEKPIRWGYYQETERKNLFKTMQVLIDLKRTYPVFETTDYQTQFSGSTKSLNLSHETMDVTIVGNFDVVSAPCFPHFQQTGQWYDYFSGDSIEVSDTNAEVTLPPGDFHIYTTQKLPTPEQGFASGINSPETIKPVEFRLAQNYPNPFNPATTIKYSLASPGLVRLEIYNTRGQRIYNLVNSVQSAGQHQIQWTGITENGSAVAAGIYWYQLAFNGRKQIRKMVYIK
ncbi:T9SS type A sorting domain-containing protein, partial [bacterium]|nr:T9SS type A sorting domain-containing protein [bacterium]